MQIQSFIRRLLDLLFASLLLSCFFFFWFVFLLCCFAFWWGTKVPLRGGTEIFSFSFSFSRSHSLPACTLLFLNIPSLHVFACDRLCIMAFNWSLWAGRICVLCAIQEQQCFELDILAAIAAPLDLHSSRLCTPSLVLQCVYSSCFKISPRGFVCECECKLWDGGLYVKSLSKIMTLRGFWCCVLFLGRLLTLSVF